MDFDSARASQLINGEWSVAVKMPIDENTLASTRAFHGITGRVRVSARRKSLTGDHRVTRILQMNSRPISSDNAKLVRYIRDMGREMAKMANSASLDLLAYLLSLVVMEAETLNASELAAGPEEPPSQD